MTMTLEVDGIQYDNFSAASCEIRLDALSNTFSFEVAPEGGNPMPFVAGDSCRVYVNERLVLTGFIEVIDVSYSDTDHTITIQGRDKTGDLLDSTLDAISDLRAPITLKQLIERVIGHIGASISVVDNVSPEPFQAAQDIASPEPGDNAFEFIEKYARQRQVLLTSDANGNVVITSGTPTQSNGSVQHIIGAPDNNVQAASFTYDSTGRYNAYKFASQLNPIALNLSGVIGLDAVTEQGGGASDTGIRSGRQLVLVSEGPFSGADDEARAKWEANIRKARGLVYSATVSGYTIDAEDDDSELWAINTLYLIADDFLGKSQPMLCNSVAFTLDDEAGEQTSLSFVDQKAYTLDLSEPRTSQTADLII